jgi:hypothetical protein
VRAQVVEHHGDASGLRVMDIDQRFDLLGEVACGAVLTHLDMTLSGLCLKKEEEIGRAAAAVFIIDMGRPPRHGRLRRTGFCEQLLGPLIETDDRPLRIVGLGIKRLGTSSIRQIKSAPTWAMHQCFLSHGFRAFFSASAAPFHR